MDHRTIEAALLHDVIEDTPTLKEELITRFGAEVAQLVDGVSKLTQIKFKSRAEAQAENFRKMVLAMVEDIRVIMVKLADRLHNMRTLGAMPPPKRRRIASETLEIYAPIAHRLGMSAMRMELEDLGFQALHPTALQGAGQASQAFARPSERDGEEDHREPQQALAARACRRHGRGTRETSLQHLPQDAAPSACH